MDKVEDIFYTVVIVLIASLGGCGTAQITNEASSSAVKDKANDAFNETVDFWRREKRP